jgi:hypothetical protein
VKEAGPQRTKHIVKKKDTGDVGFLTSLAQFFSLGPQVNLTWSNSSEIEFEFEEEHDIWLDIPNVEHLSSVTTSVNVDNAISPAMALYEDVITASTAVQDFRAVQKPVYMVTGIKWVRGIRMNMTQGRERGGDVSITADFTPVGAPVSAQLRSGGSRNTEEIHGAAGQGAFIFCVKLVKFEWDRLGSLTAEDLRKGTYMSNSSAGSGDLEAPVLSVREATSSDFNDSEVTSVMSEQEGMVAEFVYDVE